MTTTSPTVSQPAAGPVALASLAGAGGALALSTILAKLAGDVGLTPLAYLTWSLMGAAAILGVFAALRGGRPKLNATTARYFLIAGLVSSALPNLIFFSAVGQVGVGFVSLAITLPPLLTYLGALTLRMERFNGLRAGGVAAALGGALVLSLGQIEAPDAPAFWVGVTLLGPVSLAVGNIYRTRAWPAGATAEALAPGMLAGAVVFLVGAAMLLPGFSLTVPLDTPVAFGLIALQAVVFAAQFLLLFILQRTGGPVLLSLLGGVGAVIAVPVAILLLDEAVPRNLLPGALLIALGIAGVALGGRAWGRR